MKPAFCSAYPAASWPGAAYDRCPQVCAAQASQWVANSRYQRLLDLVDSRASTGANAGRARAGGGKPQDRGLVREATSGHPMWAKRRQTQAAGANGVQPAVAMDGGSMPTRKRDYCAAHTTGWRKIILRPPQA